MADTEIETVGADAPAPSAQEAQAQAPAEEKSARDIALESIEKLEQAEAGGEAKQEGRARDEHGRFAKKEAEAASPEPQGDTGTQGTEPEPPEPPKFKDYKSLGFNDEEIAALDGLSEQARIALEKRNERYHEGIKGLKEQAGIADHFIKAIQPHAEYLTALDVDPGEYLSSLAQAEMTLRLGTPEQKARMIHRMAHDYGIDLAAAAQQEVNPEIYRLQAERERLERQLDRQRLSQQEIESQGVIGEIAKWAQGKEYFEDVRADMTTIIELGKASDLESAYTLACKVNEGVQRKMAQKANEAAQKAKQSNVQLKGAPNGYTVPPKLESGSDRALYAMQQLGL